MKIFRAAIIAAALAAAACAAPATVTPVRDAPGFSMLVGRWSWHVGIRWPIYEVVELEISSVDGSGIGSGVLRGRLIPEHSVRLEAVHGTAPSVTLTVDRVQIHIPGGSRLSVTVMLEGTPIVLNLQHVFLQRKTASGATERVAALAGSLRDKSTPYPVQAVFFKESGG